MSDYIDPKKTKPWGKDTEVVWNWMVAQWEASVPTVMVPDTEENRIKTCKAVTQWFRQKYPNQRGQYVSLDVLIPWIKGLFDHRKVDQGDNVVPPPRQYV